MKRILFLLVTAMALFMFAGCVSSVQNLSIRNDAYDALLEEKDPPKAARLFEEAARNGDAESQHVLAIMYLEGEGVTKDLDSYRDWEEKAAAQDYLVAMRLLGLDLVAGLHGVKPNPKRGMAMLKAAAAGDDGGAHYILGVIYSRGTPDVKKDAHKAAFHYARAEESGRAVDPEMKSVAAIEKMNLPMFVAPSKPKPAFVANTEVKKDVQRQLKELGYYKMVIDGDIGKGSIKAIKAFQSKAGLKPTGVIDEALIAALKAALTVRNNR